MARHVSCRCRVCGEDNEKHHYPNCLHTAQCKQDEQTSLSKRTDSYAHTNPVCSESRRVKLGEDVHIRAFDVDQLSAFTTRFIDPAFKS